MYSTISFLGFLVLFFLPGAWISFGLSGASLPLWVRFASGALLTPLAVMPQYYALRLLGLSFEQSVPCLVLGNIPVLFLMWRARGNMQVTSISAWLPGAAAAALFCVVTMAPLFAGNDRMFSGQTWSYADAVYTIARGDLVPDDPEMAGYRSGYPVWAQSVHIALLAYVTDTPPMLAYATHNLLYLILTFAFAAGLVSELGGARLAKFLVGVWLFFGTNTLGFYWGWTTPGVVLRRYGDARYTPWVLKFFNMNTMPLVLAIFIAIAFLLVLRCRGKWNAGKSVLVIMLLLCASIMYPILLPAFLGMVGWWVVITFASSAGEVGAPSRRSAVMLSLGVAAVVTVTLAEVSFLAAPRVVRDLVQFTSLGDIARKGLTSTTVLAPLLLGVGLSLRKSWNTRRNVVAFLLLSAATSIALHAVFHLPYFDNEYKFIFTAAICLAPFAALATESLLNRLPRPVSVAALVALLAVMIPVLPTNYVNIEVLPVRPQAQLNVDSFHLRMGAEEPLAQVGDLMWNSTPPATVLVTVNTTVHFPTFTGRSIYVPPSNVSFDGVNQNAHTLVAFVKGFGAAAVADRRATLLHFFGDDAAKREAAWGRIRELSRPVAILVEPEHASLRAWLIEKGFGKPLYEDARFSLWLVPREE